MCWERRCSRALRSSRAVSEVLFYWIGIGESLNQTTVINRSSTHTHTPTYDSLPTYPMQAVHQDHPDLSVVLRMSLSLWTALLTQPPNLPAAVGCLLGDARVARQGIMVCWSVWSGALLFDILHSHKRLSGSSTPVTHGDTVTVWCYMPVASRWGEDAPTCSPFWPHVIG